MMQDHFWFAATRYGWGSTPASWQGWAVTALYAVLVVAWAVYVFKVRGGMAGLGATPTFIVGTLVLSALFILVAWLTGEPPRWRWGAGT